LLLLLLLPDVVEELREKGVAEVSDGATCVFVEGSEVPLIVQKSDGGYGYASTDMAAIKQRVMQEKADWVIYVTDIGQAPHFDMVFAAARKAGWLPEKGSSQVGRRSGRHTLPACRTAKQPNKLQRFARLMHAAVVVVRLVACSMYQAPAT
jgi:arginyl-tRNA synthetase